MQINKQFLATALLMIGMMGSSMMSIAYAQDTTNQQGSSGSSQSGNGGQQQQSAPGINSGMEEYPYQEEEGTGGSMGSTDTGGALEYESGYPTSGSGGSSSPGFYVDDENPAYSEQEEVNIDNSETIGASTSEEVAGLTEFTHTYPTFTNEEINERFNVTEVSENENSLAVEPIDEDKIPRIEYSEEAAAQWRSLPPDFVYTYGGEGEEGTCAGTKEFCERSHELYKSYKEKIEANEPITITDPEHADYGKLIQPESYQKGIEHMPNVASGMCNCPAGFEPQQDETNGLHCGAWGAADLVYRVRPCS
jgi:hypothetical protein